MILKIKPILSLIVGICCYSLIDNGVEKWSNDINCKSEIDCISNFHSSVGVNLIFKKDFSFTETYLFTILQLLYKNNQTYYVNLKMEKPQLGSIKNQMCLVIL